MATVGKGIYTPTVHTFFDAVRSYDVEKACGTLASDVAWRSPWGDAEDREGVQAILTDLLAPSLERPSFTIKDIAGDGNVVDLQVSVSGRFGKGARIQRWRILHLKGAIHNVLIG